MRILITGPGGYIAKRLIASLAEHDVAAVSLRGGEWRGISLDGFDAVVHLAAVVHDGKASLEQCREVNTGYTLELAQLAKAQGVGQFIFLSTMAVYGHTGSMRPDIGCGLITAATPCNPVTPYGISKHEAERGLCCLEDQSFKVCILRPPMIYGPGCPGNYRELRALALKLPLVPSLENRRGVLYVGHLCALIKLLIENRAGGLYCPQDKEYAATGRLMALIREAHGLRTRHTKICDPLVLLGACFLPQLRKAFSSLAYEHDLSVCEFGDYRTQSLPEAIACTENGWDGA